MPVASRIHKHKGSFEEEGKWGQRSPRRLLEEVESELSHSGRRGLARWEEGEKRGLEEPMKEIQKSGLDIWGKARA